MIAMNIIPITLTAHPDVIKQNRPHGHVTHMQEITQIEKFDDVCIYFAI